MKSGRTKQRMAKLLSEKLGVQVNPDEFWCNRNAEQIGCARWGVWVSIDNRNVNIHSWDTMTECLRRGFVLSHEDFGVCVVVDDPS